MYEVIRRLERYVVFGRGGGWSAPRSI